MTKNTQYKIYFSVLGILFYLFKKKKADKVKKFLFETKDRKIKFSIFSHESNKATVKPISNQIEIILLVELRSHFN
ncbi:hypothetical protein VF10_27710 [Nostoc linckia z13]|nr:hypothetical protein VF10_27710 [Nostoc linckia z13]PHK45820.1 hypothetical protein VF13_14215 [Nostoc linckia z16]